MLGLNTTDAPSAVDDEARIERVDDPLSLGSALRQDVLLASLDIPHRGFVAAKKGVKVEFKTSRRSKATEREVLGGKPDARKLKSGKRSRNEVVLKKSGEGTSSRRSRSRRRQRNIHPWGPEAQGLPEVSTLAGETASLTKSWDTSKHTFSKRASKPKKNVTTEKTPSSVLLSSVLRLEEEELVEDFESHNIRLGIEDVRRKPLKMYEWKTPYDIDVPRKVLPANKEAPGSSSSGGSVPSASKDDGRGVEQKLWDGIEELISEAFSDDESRSHMSALADVFPTHVLKALGERSLASVSVSSSSRLSSSSTPSKKSTSSITIPDEIEAAQLALNSFMDLLLPSDTKSESANSEIPSDTSTVDLDQIALAEVALNNFMDVLLTELEKDVKSIGMDSAQLQLHRQRSQRKLTLFEVFRWSLQVNIDAVEKMKYIKEHPEVQEQLKENENRALQQLSITRDNTLDSHSSSIRRLASAQVPGEETHSSDYTNTQREQDDSPDDLPTTLTGLDSSYQASTITSEEHPAMQTPEWAAIGGMPIVMSPTSNKSSPQSPDTMRRCNSVESTTSNVLPSSFLEGANNWDTGTVRSQELGFPFREGDLQTHQEESATTQSIASEKSLLSNIGLTSVTSSSGSNGMPELASIGENTAIRLAGATFDSNRVHKVSFSSKHTSSSDPTESSVSSREIRRSLSDDVSTSGRYEELGGSSIETSQMEVMSVGNAGDIHGRTGSILHVVNHNDGTESYYSNSVHSEEITLDSALLADASVTQQVPELNQTWAKGGRRRIWLTRRLLQNARFRGKCFARSLCRPCCPNSSRNRLLQRRNGYKGLEANGSSSRPSQEDSMRLPSDSSSPASSDESSRLCLLHGIHDKYDEFPVFEKTLPDLR